MMARRLLVLRKPPFRERRQGNADMRIDAAATFFPTRSGTTAPAAASSAAAPSTTEDAGGVATADFTSMTRQQLRDWINDQIRTGRMTLDDSTPFVGMTMKISTATMQPVDAATDPTRENFMEKARLGVEGALWRGDAAEAERLRAAIDVMRRFQGTPTRVDMRV